MIVLMTTMTCWKTPRPIATIRADLNQEAVSFPRLPSTWRFYLLYLMDLVLDLLLTTAAHQYILGGVLPTPTHKPAEGLRHEIYPDV